MATLPCLDLFSTPKTQNEILRSYPVVKGTSSALDDSMDLEFVFEQVKKNTPLHLLFEMGKIIRCQIMGLDCHHDNIMFFLQSSEHYTNLRESFLELRLQLVKEDGSDVVHRGPW